MILAGRVPYREIIRYATEGACGVCRRTDASDVFSEALRSERGPFAGKPTDNPKPEELQRRATVAKAPYEAPTSVKRRQILQCNYLSSSIVEASIPSGSDRIPESLDGRIRWFQPSESFSDPKSYSHH